MTIICCNCEGSEKYLYQSPTLANFLILACAAGQGDPATKHFPLQAEISASNTQLVKNWKTNLIILFPPSLIITISYLGWPAAPPVFLGVEVRFLHHKQLVEDVLGCEVHLLVDQGASGRGHFGPFEAAPLQTLGLLPDPPAPPGPQPGHRPQDEAPRRIHGRRGHAAHQEQLVQSGPLQHCHFNRSSSSDDFQLFIRTHGGSADPHYSASEVRGSPPRLTVRLDHPKTSHFGEYSFIYCA